jgi:hypothetical protein
MRRTLLVLTTLLLLLGGAAQAQQWFGIRTGYPLGVTVHYGTSLQAFDLRVSGRIVARGESVRFGVGFDALSTIARQGPLSAYIGAGPAIEVGEDAFLLDVHALVGGEFRFVEFDLDPLGVFAEGSLGGQFNLSGGEAEVPSIGAAIGVNWHF